MHTPACRSTGRNYGAPLAAAAKSKAKRTHFTHDTTYPLTNTGRRSGARSHQRRLPRARPSEAPLCSPHPVRPPHPARKRFQKAEHPALALRLLVSPCPACAQSLSSLPRQARLLLVPEPSQERSSRKARVLPRMLGRSTAAAARPPVQASRVRTTLEERQQLVPREAQSWAYPPRQFYQLAMQDHQFALQGHQLLQVAHLGAYPPRQAHQLERQGHQPAME